MCTDSHTALLQGTHSHTTVLLAAPFKIFPPLDQVKVMSQGTTWLTPSHRRRQILKECWKSKVGVGQVRTWSSQSQSHLSQQLFAISLTCATKLLREVLHSHWRSPPLFPFPLHKNLSLQRTVCSWTGLPTLINWVVTQTQCEPQDMNTSVIPAWLHLTLQTFCFAKRGLLNKRHFLKGQG